MTVRGWVFITPDEEIRWQYVCSNTSQVKCLDPFILCPGLLWVLTWLKGIQARRTPDWSSEGVQIGGIGSSTGVFGMWTTTEHRPEDPVGE